MIRVTRWVVLTLLVCLSAAAQTPKNVILIVGDGTGVTHYTFAKNIRGNDFQIGRLPVIGLMTTDCANSAITDSAAAASAMATGFKANHQAVSIDPQTGAPHETVLERAERAGKWTGLVTTAPFHDATPAAFAAHVADRHKNWLDIVKQELASGTELIVGAAGKELLAKDAPSIEALASAAGFTLVRTRAALEATHAPHMLGVLPEGTDDLDSPEMPLPDLARFALDRMSGAPKGFFLLLEEEGTDTSSHQNNTAEVRQALTSLDKTVGVALDFASKRDDTLIVVLGDHETGGLRITETRDEHRRRYEWTSIEHTATAVAVFAYGPGSAAFGKFQDNTDIGRILLSYEK